MKHSKKSSKKRKAIGATTSIKTTVKGESVAKRVQHLLDSSPYFQQAMKLGIANYSAIAKKVQKQTGGNLEAVKVAIVRYSENLKTKRKYIENVEKIIKNTKLTLKSDISVLTAKELGHSIAELFEKEERVYSVVNSTKSVTVILDEGFLSEAETIIGKWNMIKTIKDLNLLLLHSPEQIEETPGVIAFILEKLAQRAINVVEFYSCYTDTGLVLQKQDALKAFEILDKLI